MDGVPVTVVGAGVTLSWGCAADVVALVAEVG